MGFINQRSHSWGPTLSPSAASSAPDLRPSATHPPGVATWPESNGEKPKKMEVFIVLKDVKGTSIYKW